MKQNFSSVEAIEYVAGLVDAEGYFRLRRHNKSTPLGADFKLEMTNLECIKFASQVLGIKEITSQNRGPERKLIYAISAGKSGKLSGIIDLLLPFLNEKRVQASLIKEYISFPVDIQKLKKDTYFTSFLKDKYTFDGEVYFSYPYLAGILDGDGGISITQQPTNNLYVRFTLHQCFPNFAKYLHTKYGGSFAKRPSKISQHRDSYIWMAKHEQIKEILNKCKSYMIEKVTKADLTLEVLDLKEEMDEFRKRRTKEILDKYKIL